MRISVCIATYNGEKHIIDQLTTIRQQLTPEDEIIISDDSSTDSTLDKVRSLHDDRIKIFENQKFKNPIFNFEFAISQASNDLIFLSDQDDLWLDGRVEAMKEALKTVDMVVCDHSVISDESSEIIMPSYFKEVPSKAGILHNMKKNTYYGCCMAFHKSVLYKALPFPKGIPMHDIWLGFVTDVYFKSAFIDYPYTQYRRHANNVTTATDLKSSNTLLRKIKNRIDYLKYFPLLLFRFNKKHI